MTDETPEAAARRELTRERGRPLLLTAERTEQVVKLVQLGAPVELCAQGAGISSMTFYNWMKAGRAEHAKIEAGGEPDPEKAAFLEFFEAVTQARVDAATRSIGAIQKAVQGGTVVEETTRTFRDADGNVVNERTVKKQAPDWRAASWYLERQFANYFGKAPEQVEITGPDGGPLQVDSNAQDLSKRLGEHIAAVQAVTGAAATKALPVPEGVGEVHEAELVDE